MRILRIDASNTRSIRHQVLRPNQQMKACHYPGDDEEQTFHLGGFHENELVSIASFYFEKHPELEDQYQYRLRGMATLNQYRGKGYSSELLKMAFPIIQQNSCSLLWCNARENAVGFYQKVGFESVGESFEIEGIGTHLLMKKDTTL